MSGGDRMREPVIEPDLAEELDQFKGRWVAIHQGHVAADGGSAVEVINRALEKGITDPLVFRVPTNRDRLNVL